VSIMEILNLISTLFLINLFLTYTNDLFVAGTSDKKMLFVWIRIKFDAIWDFSACKTTDASSRFRVPKFHIAIVSR
jgi:hypothetical protein